MKMKHFLLGLLAVLLVLPAAAQTNSMPIFQFAIFYNSLLEFTWCGPLTVNGPTYANGNIYTGNAYPVTFNNLVSTTGTISSPAWDGHTSNQYTYPALYNAGCSTNWSPLFLPFITTNFHEIINLPPAGEDPNSPLGQQRYFNKAEIVLLVSNATVSVMLKNSPTDPVPTSVTANYYPTNASPTNYVQITTNFPWLTLTNTFTDQRESKLVMATDIDVSVLDSWLVTNAAVNAKFSSWVSRYGNVYATSSVPNIMYAADNRTYTNGQLTAVRLKNGTIIPTNNVIWTPALDMLEPAGFTVATPNPLYVWGAYNCANYSAFQSAPPVWAFPASLVSDALTILSTNWADSQSAIALGAKGKNKAASTTVNAAIITGNVPSTGPGANQFSGGAANLPRLLEDWGNAGSVTLTLNTSMVNLYSSLRTPDPPHGF